MNLKEAQAITINRLERQLAAEKLRADAFRELLDWLMKVDWDSKDNKELSNGVADITHSAVKLLARTPEDWAALALGGKSQKEGQND